MIFERHFGLLQPANMREQDQVLQSVVNGCANPPRSGWIMGVEIVGDISKVLSRTQRETQLHLSKRRNAASTSASVANCRRLA
jgi:hypothetical protein